MGKSKKKYKLVRKRTVRSSLKPKYHVQHDGVNMKVTHIYLEEVRFKRQVSYQARMSNSHEEAVDVGRELDLLDRISSCRKCQAEIRQKLRSMKLRANGLGA